MSTTHPIELTFAGTFGEETFRGTVEVHESARLIIVNGAPSRSLPSHDVATVLGACVLDGRAKGPWSDAAGCGFELLAVGGAR